MNYCSEKDYQHVFNEACKKRDPNVIKCIIDHPKTRQKRQELIVNAKTIITAYVDYDTFLYLYREMSDVHPYYLMITAATNARFDILTHLLNRTTAPAKTYLEFLLQVIKKNPPTKSIKMIMDCPKFSEVITKNHAEGRSSTFPMTNSLILSYVCRLGRMDLVEMFLNDGRFSSNSACLHAAIESGNSEVALKVLQDPGVQIELYLGEISIFESNYPKCSELAASKGFAKILDLLINFRICKPGESAIKATIESKSGNVECLKILINAFPCYLDTLRQINALLKAAQHRKIAIVEYLLTDLQFNPNEFPQPGLMRWALANARELIDTLLINPMIEFDPQSCLDDVAKNAVSLECFPKLMKDARFLALDLERIFVTACTNDHVDMVQYILSNVEKLSKECCTEAFSRICTRGRINALQLLLADPKTNNYISEECLRSAILGKHRKVYSVLLKLPKINPNLRNFPVESMRKRLLSGESIRKILE
jgi:hypothetical protein